MLIVKDKIVLDFLDSENSGKAPSITLKQVQIHLDYLCGCKITQDKHGNSLIPCNDHKNWAENLRGDVFAKYRR